jgi:hypothetical protein
MNHRALAVLLLFFRQIELRFPRGYLSPPFSLPAPANFFPHKLQPGEMGEAFDPALRLESESEQMVVC